METWKHIKGYEGLYEVSNLGRVRNLKSDSCLKLSPTGDRAIPGHLIVNLQKEGRQKSHLVHRLVAAAFIPNPQNLPIVNHKDGNKQNNAVSNLEWCTQKENVAHALREGLREKARKARAK